MRSTKIIKICSSSLCTCLHHMVILRTRNKITDFLMILAWASPFNLPSLLYLLLYRQYSHTPQHLAANAVQMLALNKKSTNEHDKDSSYLMISKRWHTLKITSTWYSTNMRARILVQVTINRRLLISRDGHLDPSEAYDNLYENTGPGYT